MYARKYAFEHEDANGNKRKEALFTHRRSTILAGFIEFCAGARHLRFGRGEERRGEERREGEERRGGKERRGEERRGEERRQRRGEERRDREERRGGKERRGEERRGEERRRGEDLYLFNGLHFFS